MQLQNQQPVRKHILVIGKKNIFNNKIKSKNEKKLHGLEGILLHLLKPSEGNEGVRYKICRIVATFIY